MTNKLVLDTSILVRFFSGDDVEKMKQAQLLLNSEKNMYVPSVVFPEIEYVLIKVYGLSKSDVMKAYLYLLSNKQIQIPEEVREANELYKISNIGMSDCIIAVNSFGGLLASNDNKLLKIKGINNYWKKS